MNGLLEYLQSFITENKKELIATRASQRTRHITVVLEVIYEPQNASAVLRSADCFGVQDVHFIENTNYYEVNPKVVRGAAKWLDRFHYRADHDNTTDCILQLKQRGYTIVATSPHTDSIALHELPVDRPLALLFGTEHLGLSSNALELADHHMYIPMYGFTESLNLSVSAAICLQHLTQKIRTDSVPWQLSDEEQQQLILKWTRLCLKDPEALERYYHRSIKGKGLSQ